MKMWNLFSVFQLILTASTLDSLSACNISGGDSLAENDTTSSNYIHGPCFNFNPQSCSGVCGQFFELWCSCDEYCQVYGRCCFDYNTVCREKSEIFRAQHDNMINVSTECDSGISGYLQPQQIITSCSLNNISFTTVKLCVKETRPSAVVSKVMSNKTGLHYKNRYCMLCNGERLDDVVYWSTMVGTTRRSDRINSVQNIINFFQNSIEIIPPPNSKEILCFPKLISSCKTYASTEEVRLCKEKALSPIRYKGDIYKNTFCLQCNVVLLSENDTCHLAQKTDLFYGHFEHSLVFSIVLNWQNSRNASVLIHSDMSFIKSFVCSLDSQDYLQTCKIRQCIGTLSVVNDTCFIGENHFGCIQYIFKINFTIPVNSNHKGALEQITSKLVQVVTNLERIYNITKYYNQNVDLTGIKITNTHLTGNIVLNRMAYNLCFLDYKSVNPERYFEYLDNNMYINMMGSISTCRYTITCVSFCGNLSQTILKCSKNQRYFTSYFPDIISYGSSVTSIYIFIIMLIFINGIVVSD